MGKKSILRDIRKIVRSYAVIGLFLILLPFIAHREVPFVVWGARVPIMSILIPGQGDFRSLCRQTWQDQCFDLMKSLPLLTQAWDESSSLVYKDRLKQYLEKKGIKRFEIKNEDIELGDQE